MALSNLSTPGVYIQEIPTLPSSIVPVSTAIPAFIGYTEKGAINTPTRITSFLEYVANFGGAFSEIYQAAVSDSGVVITPKSVTPGDKESPYLLYYHLQMYFANGGGPCHIISVGHYDHTVTPSIVAADFYVSGNPSIGISTAEEVDEVTLLVAPEVAELSSASDIRSIYDAMLAQCNKLKDRFCIFDVNVQSYTTPDPSNDADSFRNNYVSANNLNYGAAYYPSLDTVLKRNYSDDDVKILDTRTSPPFSYGTAPNNRLSTIKGGRGTFMHAQISSTPTYGDSPAVGDTFTVTFNGTPYVFTAGTDFPAIPAALPDPIPTNAEITAALMAAISKHPQLSLVARVQADTATNQFWVVARQGASTTTIGLSSTGTTPSAWTSFSSMTAGNDNSLDTALYTSIKTLISSRILTLNPSATMAGIYASVDNDRGVWKAPANVGVTNIIKPSFQVTEAQQGGLNVDATSGKSINVIRSFTGRGTLVWGARTLDGNSNEWRYVPVRRLFIMVEESVKKATEFVVFEPNDAGTWARVQGMISNFLNDLWKQGALAGAKPEQAYFVRIGLGVTMTAQDILEGKLIVTVGLAAVRPAEFIVLQFMHKLQEA